MTQIKNTIKLLLIIAALSFVVSYIISINMEQSFILLNTKWVSNEFALSCFCGVFASSLILIATEFQKYIREKRTVEHFTFNQLVIVYGELRSIRKIILDILLSNNYEEVQMNLFAHITHKLSENIEFFRLTDYNTIFHCGNNRRIKIIAKVSTSLVAKLQDVVLVFGFFPQAILTDRINHNAELLKKGIGINEKCNTIRTLNIILKEIDNLSNEIYKDIVELNTSCNNRFKWDDIDTKISNPPDLNSSLQSFYDKYDKKGQHI